MAPSLVSDSSNLSTFSERFVQNELVKLSAVYGTSSRWRHNGVCFCVLKVVESFAFKIRNSEAE